MNSQPNSATRQIANRVLVGNANGNLKFAFLTLAFAFSAPWRKSYP
jgi:hypothetical protein